MTEPLTAVLVDDSAEVRSLVRTHLRLSGAFTVVGEGASGADALALAARHRPALLLLDVSMPGMDGLTALAGVLAASPATRVVLFSGIDEPGVAVRARELGATGFLEKSLPVDRLAGELLALVRSAGPPARASGPGPGAGEAAGATAGATAAVTADEALRRSEERFRLLVEAVEDYAIFMLDPDGTVASWNPGAQRIKGYTAEEVLGTHFRRFYPVERRLQGHPERELALALRDGHYQEEGWRVRKDGSTFFAHVVLTAVRTPAGEHVGFAKVTRDITERRLATEQRERTAAALASATQELEALNARLVQAAREQAQFVAVTAHELRTPVSVVGGSAATLARHWHRLDDEERQGLLDGMVSSAARMTRLLGDLLTAARLEAGVVDLHAQPVPVADVLQAAAAAVRRDRPEDDVAVDVEPGLLAHADPDRLAQAVDNLLGNALRHGAAPVRVHAAAEAAGVVVRVRDAGPGVPPAVRPRLFERFVTGESRDGTGLGLFIVRELARAQGGDAWYEPDDDGPGGAFALSVPLAPRP